MAVAMNLNGASAFAVPAGYPFRLLPAEDATLQGVIPANAQSVSAVVQTEGGTATVHLALFTMPASVAAGVLSSDLAAVSQVDAIGVTSTAFAMTVSVPPGVVPVSYVVRLWVDSITGSAVEAISRDGTTAAANLPSIPTAVKVVSVTVA